VELPARPLPARSPAASVAAWVQWWGPGRLAGTLLGLVVLAVAGSWLLRTPTPSVEAVLPGITVDGVMTHDVTVQDDTVQDAGPVDETGTASVVVVVHVAGAVVEPGVYEVGPEARVVDAIAAAGGALERAELDALNLATPVADGSRIYVPLIGEVPIAPTLDPTAADPTGTGAGGPIDLNRAGVAELETLPGIGPATAAAIVEHRERFGPFASVDDLDQVSGIGPAKLDALRDLVTT
jgi:competence protein ComEA